MSEDVITNVANESQVKSAGKREQKRFEREQDDLRALLAIPNGRRFLWKTLSRCGVFRTSFCPGDPHVTSFNEGRREFGCALLSEVTEADPSGYLKMMHEAQEKLDGE